MRRSMGVTLLELLITLALIGILLGIGAPALGHWMAEITVTAERDRLMRSLAFARHSAVFENRTVSLCPGDVSGCADDGRWEVGWLVFTDPDKDRKCPDADGDLFCDTDGGQILRFEPNIRAGLTLRGNHWIATGIQFDSTGRAGWNNGTFSICDTRLRAIPRAVVIANTGRARAPAPGQEAACP